MGRKRKHNVNVRLDDKEYDLLKAKIKKSGQTIQSYIINSALDANIISQDGMAELKGITRILEDYDKQLRGMANNINQMARYCNSQNTIPILEELTELSEQIKQLRKGVNEQWRLTRQLTKEQKHTEQCETV